jgi:hypothetical protein
MACKLALHGFKAFPYSIKNFDKRRIGLQTILGVESAKDRK